MDDNQIPFGTKTFDPCFIGLQGEVFLVSVFPTLRRGFTILSPNIASHDSSCKERNSNAQPIMHAVFHDVTNGAGSAEIDPSAYIQLLSV